MRVVFFYHWESQMLPPRLFSREREFSGLYPPSPSSPPLVLLLMLRDWASRLVNPISIISVVGLQYIFFIVLRYLMITFLPPMMFSPFCGAFRRCPAILYIRCDALSCDWPLEITSFMPVSSSKENTKERASA